MQLILSLALLAQVDLKDLENPAVGCWYHPFYSLKPGEFQHWNDVKNWQRPWPIGGRYDMEDRKTFDRQVKQMRECGISFVVFDDTNCVNVDDGQIDRRIKTWFDYMDGLPPRERLQFCIAAGGELNQHNNRGGWTEAVDYLYRDYANRPSYARLEGKPLLLWYIDKDVWPDWTDARWTVRKAYAHHRPESKTGFSWGVRGAPSPDKECMPVMTGWHRPDSPDVFPRNNGEFYQRGWLEVLRHHPRYVLLTSWNEHAEACAIEDNTEYRDQYRRLTKGYIAAARQSWCNVSSVNGVQGIRVWGLAERRRAPASRSGAKPHTRRRA
jgi:hypothetical protein